MKNLEVLRHHVPLPSRFEAPSSWLSRLTLSQGCSLKELRGFLGLGRSADLDAALTGAALARVRYQCALRPSAFAIAERVMMGHRRVRLGSRALLRDSKGTPRFRYCPGCLKERSASTLDIHWRFVDWRHCPLHQCLMEERCWNCDAPVLYPRDMACAPAGREGHASQRRCLQCSADLAQATPCRIELPLSDRVSRMEACWLMNGRALLAALHSKSCRFRDRPMSFQKLRGSAYRLWLPTAAQWAQAELRLRGTASAATAVDV